MGSGQKDTVFMVSFMYMYYYCLTLWLESEHPGTLLSYKTFYSYKDNSNRHLNYLSCFFRY